MYEMMIDLKSTSSKRWLLSMKRIMELEDSDLDEFNKCQQDCNYCDVRPEDIARHHNFLLNIASKWQVWHGRKCLLLKAVKRCSTRRPIEQGLLDTVSHLHLTTLLLLHKLDFFRSGISTSILQLLARLGLDYGVSLWSGVFSTLSNGDRSG